MEKLHLHSELFNLDSVDELFKFYKVQREKRSIFLDSDLKAYSVFDIDNLKKISGLCVDRPLPIVFHQRFKETTKHPFLTHLFSLIEPQDVQLNVQKNITSMFDEGCDRGMLSKSDIEKCVVKVTYDLLGFEIIEFNDFYAWWLSILSRRSISGEGPSNELTSINLREEILYQKLNGKVNLFSKLCRSELNGQNFSPDEIAQILVFLLMTSFLTSVNLLGNLLYAIAVYPGHWASLKRHEMTVTSFVYEVFRFYSPVQCVKRRLNLGGAAHNLAIPDGSDILFWIGSVNHEPLGSYVPFGNFKAQNDSLHFGVSPFGCYAKSWAAFLAVAFSSMARDRDIRITIDDPGIRTQLQSFFLGFTNYSIHLQR